jgi:hypothetical protein
MLLNLLGTPGLGSFLAGRKFQGLCQMLIAFAGFVLIVGWFVVRVLILRALLLDTPLPADNGSQLGLVGAGLFLFAWVWSLFTGLALRRSAFPEPPRLPRIDL